MPLSLVHSVINVVLWHSYIQEGVILGHKLLLTLPHDHSLSDNVNFNFTAHPEYMD